MSRLVSTRLHDALERFGNRPFLITDAGEVCYSAFWELIYRTAAWIEEIDADSPLIGVLADRGPNAYLGTLSTIAAGRGFVSLTPKTPPERLAKIASLAELKTVIVDAKNMSLFRAAFAAWPNPPRALVVSVNGELESAEQFGPGVFSTRAPGRERPRRTEPANGASLLYLLFTSGSTGAPKGVPISNENVSSYLDHVCRRYAYGPGDRHSQTFELSFDLSMHDMFVAWTTGGSIVPFVGADLLAAARKVSQKAVTCWFSVPSQANLMARARALVPDAMPSLRVSLFCGEALPSETVRLWFASAPNSSIHNLYGPTEATIAITEFAVPRNMPEEGYRRGIVPIGSPFVDQGVLLYDSERNTPVSGSQKGELLLSGSQLAAGYWKAPEITAEKFISIPESGTWYRTGDLVERDDNGQLHFVGRLDQQVKVLGHRIELTEVEDAIRKAAETHMACVVAWPRQGSEIRGLTAVVSGVTKTARDILKEAKKHLPVYMLPQKIAVIDDLPRNNSGKIDRNAVVELLRNGVL